VRFGAVIAKRKHHLIHIHMKKKNVLSLGKRSLGLRVGALLGSASTHIARGKSRPVAGAWRRHWPSLGALALGLCLLLSARLSPGAVTVLYEGFEGSFPSDNGWSVRDANATGTPAFWDDVHANFGGEGAHTGNWKGYCAGVGNAGTFDAPLYQNSMAASMSRNIDLSGYCSALLTFWHKIPSIETGCDVCDFDGCRVYLGNPLCFGCGPGQPPVLLWSQRTLAPDWTQVTLDLTPYVGRTYNLKFEFKSDDSVALEGWYLDDVLVTGNPPPPAQSVTNDFEVLSSGTELSNQYPDVEFAIGPAGERLPVIEQVTGGVANSGINVLNITRPFAEFMRTYAVGYPTRPASGVSVTAGIFANSTSPGDTANLTLRAFDSSANLVGSQTITVTAGGGFHHVVAVQSCSPNITSFTIEADPDRAAFGLDDLVLSFVDGNFPDFTIQGPSGVTLVQGGAPVDVPITIRRAGGSTGPVRFSLNPMHALPAGVTANVIPNPASGGSAVIRFQAAEGPRPETTRVLFEAQPDTGQVGPPGRRPLYLVVETVPNLRVSGPAAIDFSGCAVSGTRGTIAQEYTVIRHPSIHGPINVTLEGLPANVTGTVSPQVLQFAGGAVGERLNVRLATIAGVTIPDTWAALRFAGAGIDTSFRILLHGRCPQQSRNFVVRGQFLCQNAIAVDEEPRAIAGAQVWIYRDDPYWFDEVVARTYTDAEGRFTQDVYTSEEGEYYAKLRLYNGDVKLVDAENSQVWCAETQPHLSNREGLLDFGTRVISSDNGAGTPRAAVWQGFQEAIEEFQGLMGHGIPQGQLNIEVWRGHIWPLTYYDEIHWAHGFATGGNFRYRNTYHEFGHAFRHTMDGSNWHWDADNTRFIYAREHDHCYKSNEGYAFNEGWAEYWAWDTKCCSDFSNDPEVEGTVAHHLRALSECPKVGRRGMLQVLERGPERIHSIGDFRREFAAQFPDCPMPSLDSDCTAAMFAPAAVQEEQVASLVLDVPTQRAQLMIAINSLESSIAALRAQQSSTGGLRFFALGAAAEEGDLVVQRLREQLAELDGGIPLESFSQRVFFERFRTAEFVNQRKSIQIRALQEALESVSVEERGNVERRLLLLQESRIEDDSLASMISLPPIAGDDRILARPQITRVTKSGNAVTLVWSAQPGMNYRLQFRASLDPSVRWTDLSGDVLAAGGSATKTDPNVSGAQRFYRVVLLP
jgi:hypothetical protein